MKQYTSLWLVCLLAVFSMTTRAQEGIETKARPDYPALPFMLTFEAPAEGSASLSISADGETLTSPTTLHSGTEVTITVTPADGYRMASRRFTARVRPPKRYRLRLSPMPVAVSPTSTPSPCRTSRSR